MSWKCLLFGCLWGGAYIWSSRGERLQTSICQRCGAAQTEVAE